MQTQKEHSANHSNSTEKIGRFISFVPLIRFVGFIDFIFLFHFHFRFVFSMPIKRIHLVKHINFVVALVMKLLKITLFKAKNETMHVLLL